MSILRGFTDPAAYEGGFVSIGNFDGVHLGHRHIAARLAEKSAAANVPSVILTFDPHPLTLLRPDRVPPSLTTLEQKADLLQAAGVNTVIAYPTDRALLQLTPAEFVDAVIVGRLKARGILEGPNFCFGKNRKGTVETLVELCAARGVDVEIVQPVGGETGMISSSAIRSMIVEGRIAEAIEKLGHPYRIAGRVIEGARRGRTIGFPTANLAEVKSLLPRDGVYAGSVQLDGKTWRAAANIGPNPTFAEEVRKIEVHVIGYAGDLYGRELAIDLDRRLRDTRRFDGLDELKAQLAIDIQGAAGEPGARRNA